MKRQRTLLFFSILAAVGLIAGFMLVAGATAGPLEGVPGRQPRAALEANPPWTAFDISQITGGLQTWPAVAPNPDRGSSLVVWRDERGSALGYAAVYGRLVTADGQVLSDTLIYSRTLRNNFVPFVDAVAYHPEGGIDQYLVVWTQDKDGSAELPAIYAQRVAYNGTLLGAPFQVDGGETGHGSFYPAAAHDTVNGPLMVVWSERWQADTFPYEPVARLRGRLFNGAGSPLTDTFDIAAIEPGQTNRPSMPAVAFNTTEQEYMVVWDDLLASTPALYGQRLDRVGRRLGDPVLISTYTGTLNAYLDIAYDAPHNTYFVVWNDSDGSDYEIYGQALDAAGIPVGGKVRLTDEDSNQQHPALDFRPGMQGGVFLVAWEDYRNGGNPDIYGQWVTGGVPQLFGGAIPLAGVPSYAADFPALGFNSANGNFLLAWHDGRQSDIWGARLTGLPRDLMLSERFMGTLPSTIYAGTTVTVRTVVFNLFRQPLSDVPVRFYLGDPAAGGTLLAETDLTFARGQGRQLAESGAVWDTTGLQGAQTLYAVVDPEDAITEFSETNNVISRTVTILPPITDTTPPSGTLVLNHGAALGDQITVTVNVSATDGGGSGVEWMYLREWYLTQRIIMEGATVSETQNMFANGSWTPRDIGWRRYDPLYATHGFSYTLQNSPGLHYLEARFLDGVGNLSDPPPARDYINILLNPSYLHYTGNWHLYRLEWTAGTSVTLRVVSRAGDADLFVWPPGDTDQPDYFSQNSPPVGVDQVSFSAVEGSYLVVVYGAAPNTAYNLVMQPEAGGVFHASGPQMTAEAASKGLPSLPVISEDEVVPPFSGWVAGLQKLYIPLIVR